MPANPERASRGGDMPGTTKIDAQWSVGSPIEVATASYDPGYEPFYGYASMADTKQGYCSYGISIGESSSISAPKSKAMSGRSKV
jgi:hypothetical protein